MLQNIVQKGIMKSENSKILSNPTEKNGYEDVLVRASIWNNKKSDGATYFLLRGLRKVTGEFALLCLGYNIERANLLGFEKMMEIIAGV